MFSPIEVEKIIEEDHRKNERLRAEVKEEVERKARRAQLLKEEIIAQYKLDKLMASQGQSRYPGGSYSTSPSYSRPSYSAPPARSSVTPITRAARRVDPHQGSFGPKNTEYDMLSPDYGDHESSPASASTSTPRQRHRRSSQSSFSSIRPDPDLHSLAEELDSIDWTKIKGARVAGKPFMRKTARTKSGLDAHQDLQTSDRGSEHYMDRWQVIPGLGRRHQSQKEWRTPMSDWKHVHERTESGFDDISDEEAERIFLEKTGRSKTHVTMPSGRTTSGTATPRLSRSNTEQDEQLLPEEPPWEWDEPTRRRMMKLGVDYRNHRPPPGYYRTNTSGASADSTAQSGSDSRKPGTRSRDTQTKRRGAKQGNPSRSVAHDSAYDQSGRTVRSHGSSAPPASNIRPQARSSLAGEDGHSQRRDHQGFSKRQRPLSRYDILEEDEGEEGIQYLIEPNYHDDGFETMTGPGKSRRTEHDDFEPEPQLEPRRRGTQTRYKDAESQEPSSDVPRGRTGRPPRRRQSPWE
jgi:hypothetical protein